MVVRIIGGAPLCLHSLAQAKIKMEAKIKEMEQLKDNTWMDCQYLIEVVNSHLNSHAPLGVAILKPTSSPSRSHVLPHFCLGACARWT